LPALVIELSLRARKPSKKSDSSAQAASIKKAVMSCSLIVQKINGAMITLDSQSRFGIGDAFALVAAEVSSFSTALFLGSVFRIVPP